MIENLKNMVGKKVKQLFFIVWPPFGEESMEQVDISAGYVFEGEENKLWVISTEINDLTIPHIYCQDLPPIRFDWSDFEIRMKKWMNCDEGMDLDTEYYDVTNEYLFSQIVQNKVVGVELVKISNEGVPLGVKLIFENDYILSTPINDGNTIESVLFNKNNNLDNFLSLGNIEYTRI